MKKVSWANLFLFYLDESQKKAEGSGLVLKDEIQLFLKKNQKRAYTSILFAVLRFNELIK
jgi:hypothetical protein